MPSWIKGSTPFSGTIWRYRRIGKVTTLSRWNFRVRSPVASPRYLFIKFSFYNCGGSVITLQPPSKCRCGGIGRHGRLKICCHLVYRFKSDHRHQICSHRLIGKPAALWSAQHQISAKLGFESLLEYHTEGWQSLADCTSLENWQRETARGFKSHTFLHKIDTKCYEYRRGKTTTTKHSQ